MSVSKMSPLKHDEVVSWISHLPHAISTILMCSLSRIEKNWLSLSGNGLRDTTRLPQAILRCGRKFYMEIKKI